MEPKVTKREKKLHLSYELPHRIYCSHASPQIAPNGSAVILYGHEKGFRVLWRGGRRRKQSQSDPARQRAANGVATSQQVLEISDDEDDADDDGAQGHLAVEADDIYEIEEDEQDLDCPYPDIIQDVDIDLETRVLSMAVADVPATSARIPKFLKKHLVLVAAYADGSIAVYSIPLQPPSLPELKDYTEGVKRSEILLRENSSAPAHITAKVIPRGGNDGSGELSDISDHLLVAAVSAKLDIWKLNVKPDGLLARSNALMQSIVLPASGRFASFNASSTSRQILLGDVLGAVRIFDPVETQATNSRASSRDPTSNNSRRSNKVGKWIMSFQAPFFVPKDGPAFARRKRILDVKWAFAGRGVFVLFEDGEWGIWDTTAQIQSGKSIEDFSIRGFLDSSSSVEVTDPAKQRKAATKLAPMTPNTRKSKAEDLFGSTQRTPLSAASGGISVSTIMARSNHMDECVVLWYGSDVYAIPSMQTFRQRSLGTSTAAGGRSLGSLYTPGFARITDLNLMNENITSISQLGSKSNSANALGNMNTVRDILVSAEHRLLMTQSVRPPTPTKSLFEQPAERPTSRDQRMLDVGELDLGGMDRMLDSMVTDGRTKRVGFAAT